MTLICHPLASLSVRPVRLVPKRRPLPNGRSYNAVITKRCVRSAPLIDRQGFSSNPLFKYPEFVFGLVLIVVVPAVMTPCSSCFDNVYFITPLTPHDHTFLLT